MHNKKLSRSLGIVRKFFPNVDTVEDAKQNIDIEVTSRDVSTSERKKHNGCAMAVACKRARNLDGVIIATSTAYLIKGNKATRLKVPVSAAREVVAFDRGASFEPGDYALRAPSRQEKLGHITGGKNPKDTGTGKPHKRYHLTANVRAVLGGNHAR